MTETFGKYPLDRFSRNSQKISVSPTVTETFGKYQLRPPRPKLSGNIRSTATPETFKKHLLARRVRERKIFTLFYML